MPENQSGRAGGKRGSQNDTDVHIADAVLTADGDDMGSGDAIVAVDEKAREVFAIGKADERVKDPGRGVTIGDAFFGESQGTAGLHEAHFVDGDGVSGLASGGLGGFHGGSGSLG